MAVTSNLTLIQGDTRTITIPVPIFDGVQFPDLSTATEIIFLAKASIDDPDNAAVIDMRLSDAAPPQVTKDDALRLINLIFYIGETSNITPGKYLPFLKVYFGNESPPQQNHVTLSIDSTPWKYLIIGKAGIQE